MASRPPKLPLHVGDEAEVTITAVAHGGHMIAHHAGHTLFVRHAIPGERVRVIITEVRSKFARADAVQVLTASAERITPACPWATPGGCGGCDFQHVSLNGQRELKGEVITSALSRAGVWGEQVVVESLGDDGSGWRSRMRWSVDAAGRVGLLRHRSHDVVHVGDCLIATPGIRSAEVTAQRHRGAGDVRSVEGSDGSVSILVDGIHLSGPPRVMQRVGERTWRLDPGTFWQVHPQAAQALVSCVLDFGAPAAGERWWDLYSGAGLFSAFLGDAVGPLGVVDAVESSADSVRDARRALHDLPQVRLHLHDVGRWRGAGPLDGVVLDPPRAGAGAAVIETVVAASPRVIVYVACDPIALSRDLASLAAGGYRVEAVRAFDTFPMTHHVETVAALVPVG